MINFKLRLKTESLCYLLYVILLYVLAIAIWPLNHSEEFLMYSFALDIDEVKLVFSIICALIIWLFVNAKYYSVSNFSNQVILLLIVLYFLPGIVMAGVLNFEWGYLIQYMLYFIVLVISDYLFFYPKHYFPEFDHKSVKIVKNIVIIISLLYPFYMARIYSKSFSIAELVLTLSDPYGARTASKEMNVSWVILAIEYASIYMDVVLITHFIKEKKKILAAAFVIVGLFYFLLQGNRQFVLLVILGVLFGFLKPSKKVIAFSFLGMLAVQLLEYYIIQDINAIGPITNVFRRFSLVPNKISAQYYDFFQQHEPDLLRGIFTRISSLLNIESPYGNNQIGYIIGNTYYGWAMNANNGLFGGAYLEFGNLGFIIDPIMLLLLLRLYEKVLYRSNESIRFITAIVFVTIVINQQVVWAQSIRPTQYMLFWLLLLLFFNSKEQDSEGSLRNNSLT